MVCLEQDKLLWCGGFKQGAYWSKEQFIVEVKGVQLSCRLGAATLEAWFSVNTLNLIVRFRGYILTQVFYIVSKS